MTVLSQLETLIAEDGDTFLLEDGDTLDLDSVAIEAGVVTILPLDNSIRCNIFERVNVLVGNDEELLVEDGDTFLLEDGDTLLLDSTIVSAVRIYVPPIDYSIITG